MARSSPIAQSMQNVDLTLHSLGWKAFQDLCVTILKEIHGQTVQHFFDSRDGGRDGAFSGVWRQKANEEFRGQFTVHCQFSLLSRSEYSPEPAGPG
jgi:hypothetical protein